MKTIGKYEPPMVEVVAVEVERGFINTNMSLQGMTVGDWIEGGSISGGEAE